MGVRMVCVCVCGANLQCMHIFEIDHMFICREAKRACVPSGLLTMPISSARVNSVYLKGMLLLCLRRLYIEHRMPCFHTKSRCVPAVCVCVCAEVSPPRSNNL